MRPALVVSAVVMLVSLAGCSKDKPPPAAVDAGAASTDAATATATATATSGEALVTGGCLSCHSNEMLAQQRLTEAQWKKTVTKMVSWGATVEPTDVPALVAYLSSTYSPDAGAYAPTTLTPAEALDELARQDDGPLADGNAERGRPLYTEKCSGCHGGDARGHIGVLLIDRPFLYRAADFAKVVRRGRGKMTATAMSDQELADVLAHLRGLENPAP